MLFDEIIIIISKKLFTSVCVRARSQLPLYGLTGRALGGRSAAPGAAFRGQNLENSIFHA